MGAKRAAPAPAPANAGTTCDARMGRLGRARPGAPSGAGHASSTGTCVGARGSAQASVVMHRSNADGREAVPSPAGWQARGGESR
eukprot:6922183-Alexandrium_andersonii.AAC.1